MLRLFTRRPNLRAAASSLERYRIAVEVRDRFVTFLERAQDRELFHFNPRYLAERLGLDERATLKLLLAALYEGIVTLHWDVRCPACGAISHHGSTLSGLRHDTRCSVCQTEYAPRLDDEVRVTFSPHSRLRALSPAADNAEFREQIDTRLGPVSGQALLLLPDFRRLFPQEHVLPDESLEVSRVALIFTDLAGSTALYAARGDPRAYHLVRLHFDELFAVADDHNGAVVKNIGDAVMAAFQTPAEALDAALAMQRGIDALNRGQSLTAAERLILKVGLHSGPCLNVTLNDRPDYFGTTVNIAARVQGLSHGGDIVFTDTIRSDSDAQAVMGNQPLESILVTLKGIEGQLLVHRMTVFGG